MRLLQSEIGKCLRNKQERLCLFVFYLERGVGNASAETFKAKLGKQKKMTSGA